MKNKLSKDSSANRFSMTASIKVILKFIEINCHCDPPWAEKQSLVFLRLPRRYAPRNDMKLGDWDVILKDVGKSSGGIQQWYIRICHLDGLS